MKRKGIVLMVFLIIVLGGCLTNQNQINVNSNENKQIINGPNVNLKLDFRGWYQWGGIEVVSRDNILTLNGKFNTAGYVTEQIPQSLKGRTIILEIQNTEASNFFDDRMLKITINKNDRLIRPLNIPNLIEGEYIPSNFKQIEFVLPDDFDGKLGFVFYQAELKNLQITATYK